MNMKTLKVLDVVALLKDIPAERLITGQVGTVVEQVADDVFEVEFADKQGRTLVMLPIHSADLLLLHYELEVA